MDVAAGVMYVAFCSADRALTKYWEGHLIDVALSIPEKKKMSARSNPIRHLPKNSRLMKVILNHH